MTCRLSWCLLPRTLATKANANSGFGSLGAVKNAKIKNYKESANFINYIYTYILVSIYIKKTYVKRVLKIFRNETNDRENLFRPAKT